MPHNIKYYSTNRNAKPVAFKEALLKGQAPDRGLYMPERVPNISLDAIVSMKGMAYCDIAFTVLNEFLGDEITENELRRMTKEAYNYDIPLEHVTGRSYLMRLDQGPTASFKDFAARMMARLTHHCRKGEEKDLIILTATSGDTGSAVANAFYGLSGIKMVVLFPDKEVSERQRKQMTTLGGNVIAAAVDGKFDDCQAFVKQAFADSELAHLNLSSANSINVGRLLPQTVYYFYAYSRVREKENDEIIFSVPCGNFGNLMGGLLAKKMGLPVCKFVAATNENDEFPKFLETGEYAPIKPSRACISNAMNVGHPSNLARLVDIYGGHMDEKGIIREMPDVESMKKDIFSASVSDEETVAAIKNAHDKYGIVLEPHGAVGWAGLEKFLSRYKNSAPCVSLETAHPAKFPEELKKIFAAEPELPKSMKNLEIKEEKFEKISSDYKGFREFLRRAL